MEMNSSTEATGSHTLAQLRWEGVTYRLAGGRLLLDGVSGAAFEGRLLAILGPSGAGKTTLLKALANRLEKDSGARLSGKLTYEPPTGGLRRRGAGQEGGDTGVAAYVAQETAFFSNLTVRETVVLAARLRAGGGGEDAAEAHAQALCSRLGLSECMNTLVGGDTGGRHVNGISGGEKRRLAIACELAGGEDGDGVLLADEPTSGLDSFQADLVVAKLKDLAINQDAIVVCTLHQPRSASLDRLDDLCLLSPNGRVVYIGPLHDCLPHFESLGHVCPERYNLAEFLVDLVSVDTSSEDTKSESLSRVTALEHAWEERCLKDSAGQSRCDADSDVESTAVGKMSAKRSGKDHRRPRRPRAPFLREFRLLFGRVFRQTRRDGWSHVARTAAGLLLGAAYGATNFRLGNSQRSIKSRASLMFQLCITTSMMSVVKTLNSFPRERVTVEREMARGRGRGGYGAGSYFLSKLLVETPVDALFPVLFGAVVAPLAGLNPARRLPFLGVLAAQSMAASGIGLTIGAACPSVDTALALGPALMVVSIMVADESGMFADIPPFMRPLAKLSVVKWGFQGCIASEMRGLTFTADDSLIPRSARDAAARGGVGEKAALESQRKAARRMCLTSGEAVLDNLGFSEHAVCDALKATGSIYLLNAVLAYVVMRVKARPPVNQLTVAADTEDEALKQPQQQSTETGGRGVEN